MSDDDAIECKVRGYVTLPRVTHRMKIGDQIIGLILENGSVAVPVDDSPAPQDSARPMSGETPT